MKNIIEIRNIKTNLTKKAIENWIKEVLNALDKPKYYLSLVITNNSEIRMINKEYLNKDYETDVLSFSQYEGETPVNNSFLGDIIISYEFALLQSSKLDHTVEEEIKYLLLHGILHLLGYDHDENETGEMSKIEKEIYYRLTGTYLI